MEHKNKSAASFLDGLMDGTPSDFNHGQFRTESKSSQKSAPNDNSPSEIAHGQYRAESKSSLKSAHHDNSSSEYRHERLSTTSNPSDRKTVSSNFQKAPLSSIYDKAPISNPSQPSKVKKSAKTLLKRRSQHNRLLTFGFSLVVLIFIVLHLVSQDRTYSEAENRNLAQFPAFSTEALLDGSYFSGLDSYIADQFFSRDSWMGFKLQEDQFLGRKEAGGVFLGKDGYLLSQPAIPNESSILRTAKSINTFASQHPDLSFVVMVAPGSGAVQPQFLPEDAPIRDQKKDIQLIYDQISAQIKLVDVADALQDHADEYIYYKTDHHWTSLGAFYAFCAAAGKLGLSNPWTRLEDYQVYPVAADFQGTLSSKSGSHQAFDIVDIYLLKEKAPSYYVNYVDSGRKVTSFYQSQALESKDKYTVFFGGNHPLMTIKTTADNDRALLIFKDSYANSFIPFLYPYYEDIVVIDPRYYYENLSGLMNNYAITDVLFLYSADTLVTDTALADVLGVE